MFRDGHPFVTEHLRRTMFCASASYFITYLPFLLALLYALVAAHQSWWLAVASGIEHAFIGGLAVSCAACLMYIEYERDFPYHEGVWVYMACSGIGVATSFLCFFLYLLAPNEIRVGISLGSYQSFISLAIIFFTSLFSFILILQIRRARDLSFPRGGSIPPTSIPIDALDQTA